MPANGLGHFDIKTTLIYVSVGICLKLCLVHQKPGPLRCKTSPPRNPLPKGKILYLAKFPADPLWEILQVPPKSVFKHLVLETPLWQSAMSSSNLKSLPEGLKNLECKKGTLIAWPPIPYVPPVDLHEKQEPKQIKVKLPDGTHFQMSAFRNGNNKEYFIYDIAVMHLIKQKGTAQDVKKAFEVLVEVRRELQPLLEVPDNKTEIAKEERKKKFLEIKKTLKTKH
jgi:hypothetical protein